MLPDPHPPEGRVIIQLQVLLAFLSHLEREKSNFRTSVKAAGQEHRPTKRLRFNHKIVECFWFLKPQDCISRASVSL